MVVAFDEVVKCRKLLVLLCESIWLCPSATPLVRVAERICPVVMVNDPIVHDLSIVTDGEGVGVVHRTTLADQEMTFYDTKFTEHVLH